MVSWNGTFSVRVSKLHPCQPQRGANEVEIKNTETSTKSFKNLKLRNKASKECRWCRNSGIITPKCMCFS